MSYIQEIIGNNIKKYRNFKHLTLEKLAEKVGISYQNISKIENGRSFFKAETLEKICEVLDVTPAQLVSVEDLPEKVENDNVKPLLHQFIRNLEPEKVQALYKLVLAFQEATK